MGRTLMHMERLALIVKLLDGVRRRETTEKVKASLKKNTYAVLADKHFGFRFYLSCSLF